MAGCNHKKKSCTSKDCRGLDVPMYCKLFSQWYSSDFVSANPMFFVGILKAWKFPPFDTQKTRICVPSPQCACVLEHFHTACMQSETWFECVDAGRDIYLHIWETFFLKFHAQHDKWIRITNPSTYIINSRSTIHNYHLLPKPSSRGFKGFTKTIPFNHGLRWRLRCPPPHVSQESDQLLLGLMGHDLNEEGGTYGGIFWCIP